MLASNTMQTPKHTVYLRLEREVAEMIEDFREGQLVLPSANAAASALLRLGFEQWSRGREAGQGKGG